MAVTLTGTGGLFTRIGLMAKFCRMFNGSVGSTAPSNASAWGSGGPTIVAYGTLTDSIEDQYEAALQSQIKDLYPALEAFRASGSTVKTYFKQLAENTLIEQVHADTPLLTKTVGSALTVLISQMTGTSDSVKANVVSAAAASAGSTNVGNAVVIASVVGPNGKNREFAFPETLRFTVTNDSLNGATAGAEPIGINGILAQSDPLNYTWPKGSGLSGKQINMVSNGTDATASSTTTNLLKNSEFVNWTSTNTLDNFGIITGAAGGSILRSGTARKGSYSLSYVGDGAELTSMYQEFNNAGGSPAVLKPSKVYAFSAWVYCTVQPAAGVMAFDLTNGSNTVITDDAGTNNTISKTLTSVGASWVNVTGFFRTKTTFSGTARLRIRLTTAVSVGTTLLIDDVHMTEATELYTGGPYVAAFRGTTDVMKNDYWTIAIANNMSAAGTAGGVLQTAFEQFFKMRESGYILPSVTDGSQTVADTLAF